jgi:hypothetical protein
MSLFQQILGHIRELHRLDGGGQIPEARRFDETTMSKEIQKLRKKIPTSILGHYDRQRLRGKKSFAPVCNKVCGACYLQIPKATVLHMQETREMGVCDNCGAFIYLPEPETPQSQEPPKAKTGLSKRSKTTAKIAA